MKTKKIIGIAGLVFVSFGAQGQKLEKQATVEVRETMVFYEGIPMDITYSVSGDFKQIKCNIPHTYTAPKGSAGSSLDVTFTGIDKKGNEVDLGTKKFIVKKAPKPELFWNNVADGGNANLSGGSLQVRYGDNVPFSPSKGQFNITNYTLSINGVNGVLRGNGSMLSPSDLSTLRSLNPGSNITISVLYTGTRDGFITAEFVH